MPRAEQKKEADVGLIIRSICAAVLFILGFNFSYASVFKENPMFGVPFLAEILISLTFALVGFYIVPQIFLQIKHWIEELIINTVSEIVSNFWEQQSTRINAKRREKQKLKAQEEKAKLTSQITNSVLLDTSVLVDGRILDIVRTKFMKQALIIPSAVANELHLIADSNDKLKRERGRRGLDIIKRLRKEANVITPTFKTTQKGVDNILLEFAKNNKVPIMTLDFNLNKLAGASGVEVLNVNDLVEAVKISVLPGEILGVELVQLGKEKNQGVGYMPDGTMVVVKNGDTLIGSNAQVRVSRIIQSSAGKIIFAEISA